jgi:probable HAF family extracellular repeat protein
MNSRGQIIGQGHTGHQRAVLWEPDGSVRDLGTLPGQTFAGTSRINDHGEIVGWSAGPGGTESWRAFLWTEDEGMLDLNDLLDASGRRWDLEIASGINESGQIIASGWLDGHHGAVLLTPVVPEPTTMAGLLTILALSTFARRACRLRRWPNY